ncbi:MAG TPA: cytochrome C oxidase subunit IV family protein [Chryseosolibacter sp.]
MASHSHEPQVTVLPPNKEKIRQIWKVFFILLGITILEFIVAFTISHDYETLRIAIFVGMTIIKAAYIVGEFMHLRHEAKVLIWSILIPMVFVVWMLVAFVYEGMAIFNTKL